MVPTWGWKCKGCGLVSEEHLEPGRPEQGAVLSISSQIPRSNSPQARAPQGVFSEVRFT